MKASAALDAALEHSTGSGRITADGDHGSAAVDLVAVGPIGVRVRAVEVTRAVGVDVGDEAAALPERLRTLPERVVPVEVDRGLGGAVLRTPPDQMREREFFEVEVRPNTTTVRRHRVEADGSRQAADFALTRDQLGRLVDELGGTSQRT